MLVCLLASGLSWQQARASHMMGMYTEMECISACTTRVHFRAYRDCSGVTSISNTLLFTPVTLGCGTPSALGAASSVVTVEVTPVCAATPTQCTVSGAAFAGVEEYYSYQDFDVCGLTGCSYTISFGSCCRNGVITSGAGNESAYVVNDYTVTPTCNNTPVFTNYPLFYGCVGANYTVHQGAYDADGDSLVYALGPCYQSTTFTPVTYNAGYSPTQPLGPTWTCSIDANTGILSINATPGNAVVGVICISVSEYRAGVLIGISNRDMQVQMGSFCGGNVAPTVGSITNVTGAATATGPYDITVCPGNSFCFDISATDPDTSSGQYVKLYWDGNIAGATFTEAGFPAVVDTVQDSTPVGRFCWTAPMVAGTYQFLVTAEDNACPLIVPQDQLITIHVTGISGASLITPSNTLQLCSGASETLTAPLGYASYSWSTGATTSSIVTSMPGGYGLTVTTGSGCSYTDAVVVTSLPADISGTILDNLGAPLASQKVYLIDHDPSLGSLSAVDSTTTDVAGYYEFCSVTIDTAYVKAAPDSMAYPNDMPTYYAGALFWMGATGIDSFPAVANFSTLFGSNPGGPGFIGGLLSMGANKTLAPGDPMPGMTMWLYSSTLSQPIGWTRTDINGYFSFSGLPLGDYYVIADKPGVSTTNVPSLTLDAQHMTMDSLDFRLHTTYLELVLNSVGVTPGRPAFGLTISPNPMGDAGTLRANLSTETELGFGIYDLRGRQLYSAAAGTFAAGQHQFRLSPAAWGISAGTYFVRVQAGAELHTLKIVVQ